MGKTRTHNQLAAILMVLIIKLFLMHTGLSQSSDSIHPDQPGKRPRFHLQANGVYAILETSIRFEIPGGMLGLKISLEDHLGLQKYKLMPVLNATVNLKKRHNLLAMFYHLPRESYYQTKREFEFNGQVVEAGTEIFSYWNTNLYSMGYMFDAVSNTRGHLGLFLNVFVLTFRTGIRSSIQPFNEKVNVNISLPNFGIQTDYKFTDRFGLSGLLSIFFISAGELAGSIHVLGGQLDYKVTRWLDLGMGYYMFDLDIELERSQFTGIFDYTYQGPYLSAGFRF